MEGCVYVRLYLGLVILALLCPGCGRRSPSISSTSTRRTGQWATPMVGDKVVRANMMTVAIAPGTTNNVRPTGQQILTILESTNHGRVLPPSIVRTFDVREDILTSLGGLSRSRFLVTWFGLDAQGNTYILGESDDGLRWDLFTDSDPPVCFPATIQPGSSWGYTAHFASGGVESVEMKCLRTEKLNTSAGVFDAYVASGVVTRKGSRMQTQVWLSPSVPAVFELKVEGDGSAEGMPNVHLVSTVESVSLAK